MRSRRPYLRTAAIVAVLLVLSLVGTRFALRFQPAATPLDFWAYFCLVAGPLTLFLRHRFPAVMVVLTMGFSGWYLFAGYPAGPQPLSFAFAIIFAFIAGQRVIAWSCVGLGVLGVVSYNALAGGETWPVKSAALSAWLLILALVGTGIKARMERAELLRRRRREQAMATRSAERLALARDIHDVVAHSLSSINVRASVALHLAQRDPSQLQPALQAIKSSSKEALDEVRELLGVLREDVPLQPVSPLSRLPKLIDDAEAGGLQVEQDIELALALTAEQESVIYRVIQEALTNVIRHAAARTVKIALASSEGKLKLQIDDDGVGLRDSVPGNGILGMRERLTGLAGELELVESASGLSVRAQLPLSNNPLSGEADSD